MHCPQEATPFLSLRENNFDPPPFFFGRSDPKKKKKELETQDQIFDKIVVLNIMLIPLGRTEIHPP